jgi:hypothetical protein
MEEIKFPLILVWLIKQTKQYSVVMVVQIESKTCFVLLKQCDKVHIYVDLFIVLEETKNDLLQFN